MYKLPIIGGIILLILLVGFWGYLFISNNDNINDMDRALIFTGAGTIDCEIREAEYVGNDSVRIICKGTSDIYITSIINVVFYRADEQ